MCRRGLFTDWCHSHMNIRGTGKVDHVVLWQSLTNHETTKGKKVLYLLTVPKFDYTNILKYLTCLVLNISFLSVGLSLNKNCERNFVK